MRRITKHGKPVAELQPVSHPRPQSPFGLAAGGEILGDLISPVLEPSDWSASALAWRP